MKIFALFILALNCFALSRAATILIPNEEFQEQECDPTVGGAYAHETDCEKYYICRSDGVPELYTCDDMMLFDLVYMGCNFAEYTNCGDRIRPPGYATTIQPITTLDPGVTPDPDFKCPSPGGAFPHPVNCELYYVCTEDIPKLHKCEEDYLFDLTYDGCNFPEQTDCQDRIRPNGTATLAPTRPPVTGGEDFECPEAGGAFPHPERCELYYVCIEDFATLNECPVDQLFDLEYFGCNYEELVVCGDRERPPGTGTDRPTDPTKPTEPEVTEPEVTKPTEAPGTGPTPGPGFECPEATGVFPDPLDCSGFYNCDNFVGLHEYCSVPLYFNPEVGVCDHQANVDCGDRPEPSP